MSMTASDIRNYKFPTVLRGYDKDAVDSFLEQVAQRLDQVTQESMRMSMEFESIKGQLSALKQFEDTIKNAAIDSRRNADMLIATARQEAAQLLAKAKEEAESVLASRSGKVTEIEQQLKQLELTRTQYLNKLRTLISQHLDLINQVSSADHREQQAADRLEVIGSTDMSRRKTETIAARTTKPAIEKTEEANAASRIIAHQTEEPQPAPRVAPAQAAQPQPAPETVPAAQIDPELAAALLRYQQQAREKSAAPAEPTIMHRQTPSGTSAIPVGNASAASATGDDVTDRVRTAAKASVISDEPNSLQLDVPVAAERPAQGGMNLARELDEVVARFEEEMDKAARGAD